MERDIEQLPHTTFDIVILGGGITGACLAHDAALRGLRVALVEKDDFGMSTSSASSKLLHGGIRYLQKLQFGKVRESARERAYFQKIAPHLTSYVPFLIPTFQRDVMKGKLALTAGMVVYRMLCSGLNGTINDPAKKAPSGRLFGKSATFKKVPLLKNISGINGSHTLYESHIHNSERMTLAFIKSAVKNGASVANHSTVIDFRKNGRHVTGVLVKDNLSHKEYEVSAKIVVNASGPFLPSLNSKLDGLDLHRNTTGFSKGVHLVTRQINGSHALALSSTKKTEGLVTRGGRHIFIIPWRGQSLIGTTNVPYEGKPDDITVTDTDIVDFLQDINAMLPGVSLIKSDVQYAFAGLYPLTSEEIHTDTYQGTGEYQVVDHGQKNNIEGIISVLGAKYTTARAISEQAVDIIAQKLSISLQKCQTADTPLFEGNIDNILDFFYKKTERYKDLFDRETIRHLVVSHGSNIDTVINYMQSTKGYCKKLSPHRYTLVGEIAYAVEFEMARRLDDVVFARTGLGTIGHPGSDVIEKVADLMANLLGWSEEQRYQETEQIEMRYRYL
jgi:glycerol-3-phosphate dehydrogenase